MTRNEYLRQYLKYGWTIVPVKPGTKYPAIEWKKYQTQQPTNDELREWFKDPETGVGLITGKASGVIVVDEDSYKKEGKELALDTPLKVLTGRGGKHYYFKYKEGIRNSVNKENAIDGRGEGGFVVLPPTLHPDSGVEYTWMNVLPADLSALPTLDESVAQELIKSHNMGQPLNFGDYLEVQEGGRNDSLYRITCSILNKVPAKEAYVIVNGVNQGYHPPLREYEVKTIFESALRFVREHPKTNPTKTSSALEVITYLQAKEQYKELMKRYGEGMTTGYKILDDYFRFVPQQLYMLSAPTHVGKTTLALNMAGRCAKAGFDVVFASLEQGVFVIPRLESIFGDETQLIKHMRFIAPVDLPRPGDFTTTFQNPSVRPKILIVDHLHYFARGNRGATEEMDRLVVEMQAMAKKLEIPVIAIAHVRKLKEDKPPTMDDLKDSSSLSQIPAMVAMMHRDKNPEEIIKAGGRIYSDSGTLFIYKNRIFGKDGSETFKIYDTGEIIFDREPTDKINEYSQIVGLEGFFDD